MNKIDLSPRTDTTSHLLLSDSDAILSRELYRELRSHGYSVAESLRIVHAHNGYESPVLPQSMAQRFTRKGKGTDNESHNEIH